MGIKYRSHINMSLVSMRHLEVNEKLSAFLFGYAFHCLLLSTQSFFCVAMDKLHSNRNDYVV